MRQRMIRISDETLESLREIARSKEDSMQTILDRAVEEYRRRHFLEEVNRAYERLRQNPDAWREEVAERSLWDQTLADGLPSEESASEPQSRRQRPRGKH